MTTAGIYERAARRFVEMAEVIRLLGIDATPRPPSEAERIFMASHTGLRALAKGWILRLTGDLHWTLGSGATNTGSRYFFLSEGDEPCCRMSASGPR